VLPWSPTSHKTFYKNQTVKYNTRTNQEQTNERNKNKTWTTTTYYSPKIRKITNLFKHTNVGISCKNINTLQQITKPKIDSIQEQDKNRIYELTHMYMPYVIY
jgi:hypothetical protein